MSQSEKANAIPSPPLRLTLFGQPQITVSYREERRPEVYALPGDDWVLLLVYLAYFGERDSHGGSVERSMIESSWRDARAKDVRGTPEYFGYSASGAVRNATSEMRRYIARLCEGTIAESEDIVELTGKGLLRLNRRVITSDIGDFFDQLRRVRQADLPDDANLAREYLTAAQNLFEEGEFLPGFEHRFGRYEIQENGQGLESWVLDARRSLQTKQNQTAERLVKLAPFLLLPAYENVFVPREELSAAMREWLFEEGGSSGRLPALVLHGGYGAGKTRLAIETVRSLTIREALGLYPEGIAFLPLDSYFTQPGSATETAFLQAVAQQLRAPEAIQNSLTSHHASDFFRWIGAKPKRLLILDNGESLYSEITAKALTRLLHSTDGRLRCLITSRAAWPGLRHIPIDGLPLPSSLEDDFESLVGSRLYMERVRQRNPEYAIPDRALLITALEQTEGLPLNIELLAGRAWDKGVEGFRTLVEQRRLSLLAVQGPDPPTMDNIEDSSIAIAVRRHRSATASIFWSIDRLPEDERVKFVRLAVFPYDWNAEAAEAICGATEEELRVWRDLYLITYDLFRDRWLLRPRIREVVQEIFATTLDIMRTREKHRDYYVPISQIAAAQMRNSEVKIGQKSFEFEIANFRAASNFCLTQPDVANGQSALELAISMQAYLTTYGQNIEAVNILREAVEHTDILGDISERLIAINLIVKIYVTRLQHMDQPLSYINKLISIASSCASDIELKVYVTLCGYFTNIADLNTARKYLNLAEQLLDNSIDHDEQVSIYNSLMGIEQKLYLLDVQDHVSHSEDSTGYKWLKLAVGSAKKSGNLQSYTLSLSNIANAANELGYFDTAYEACSAGLRIAFANGLTLQTQWFFNVAGQYCFRRNLFSGAVKVWTYGGIFGETIGTLSGSGIQEALAACKDALGQNTYVREEEIACSWSLEQAVEYVLALPPPPDSEKMITACMSTIIPFAVPLWNSTV